MTRLKHFLKSKGYCTYCTTIDLLTSTDLQLYFLLLVIPLHLHSKTKNNYKSIIFQYSVNFMYTFTNKLTMFNVFCAALLIRAFTTALVASSTFFSRIALCVLHGLFLHYTALFLLRTSRYIYSQIIYGVLASATAEWVLL